MGCETHVINAQHNRCTPTTGSLKQQTTTIKI